MAAYEPLSFEDEINEISDCIFENKIYDEAPGLDRLDLVLVLEHLGYSDAACGEPLSTLDLINLKSIASSENKINEDLELMLRQKIRKILLGN